METTPVFAEPTLSHRRGESLGRVSWGESVVGGWLHDWRKKKYSPPVCPMIGGQTFDQRKCSECIREVSECISLWIGLSVSVRPSLPVRGCLERGGISAVVKHAATHVCLDVDAIKDELHQKKRGAMNNGPKPGV